MVSLADLGAPPRTRGRTANPPAASFIRPLNEADIALLQIERGTKPPSLTRIRDSHHAIARLLALGHTNAAIMRITGYSASRISILKGDPTFKELVAHYRMVEDHALADLQGRMVALSLDAVQELQDRLDVQPEEFKSAELLDLVKVMADRTGHGPQTKSTNVNVNIDVASRLGAARRRAGLIEAPSPAAGASELVTPGDPDPAPAFAPDPARGPSLARPRPEVVELAPSLDGVYSALPPGYDEDLL